MGGGVSWAVKFVLMAEIKTKWGGSPNPTLLHYASYQTMVNDMFSGYCFARTADGQLRSIRPMIFDPSIGRTGPGPGNS